jgi:hypothetical protein
VLLDGVDGVDGVDEVDEVDGVDGVDGVDVLGSFENTGTLYITAPKDLPHLPHLPHFYSWRHHTWSK